MKKLITLLLFAWLHSGLAQNALITIWQQTFDYVRCDDVLRDGSYIVISGSNANANTSRNNWIRKCDQYGSEIWTVNPSNYTPGTQWYSYTSDIHNILPHNNGYVVGAVYDGAHLPAALALFDKNGSLVKQIEEYNLIDGSIKKVLRTGDGGYLSVYSCNFDDLIYRAAVIIKADADLNLVSKSRIGCYPGHYSPTDAGFSPTGLCEFSDGYVVCGRYYPKDSDDEFVYSGNVMYQVISNSHWAIQRLVNSTQSSRYSPILFSREDRRSEFLVTDYDPDVAKRFLRAYNLSGNVIWERYYEGSADWDIINIAAARDGGYLLVGSKGHAALLIKIGAYGDLSWMHQLPSAKSISAVIDDGDDKYLVSGSKDDKTGWLAQLQRGRFVHADFSVYKQSGNAPFGVWFRNESQGEIDRHTWDFGDGTTSDQFYPFHVYQEAGTYTVTLTVENDYDSNTKTAVDFIVVSPPSTETYYVKKAAIKIDGNLDDWALAPRILTRTNNENRVPPADLDGAFMMSHNGSDYWYLAFIATDDFFGKTTATGSFAPDPQGTYGITRYWFNDCLEAVFASGLDEENGESFKFVFAPDETSRVLYQSKNVSLHSWLEWGVLNPLAPAGVDRSTKNPPVCVAKIVREGNTWRGEAAFKLKRPLDVPENLQAIPQYRFIVGFNDIDDNADAATRIHVHSVGSNDLDIWDAFQANYGSLPLLQISNDYLESISVPGVSSTSVLAMVGQTITCMASAAQSNLGHALEYQFDWGDGLLSGWGPASQSHSYGSPGGKDVRVRARCQLHTGILTDWSDHFSILISFGQATVRVVPANSGVCGFSPAKTEFTYGETVQVSAQPRTGYQFDSWAGDLSGRTNPALLTMNGDKSITAYFLPAQTFVPHYTFAVTDESYSIVIQNATIDDAPLRYADEIGVFTPAGLCVGASVWTGALPLALVAWKDDAQTASVIDGYREGESMSFKIWHSDGTLSREYSAVGHFTRGNGSFGNSLYSIMDPLMAKTISSQRITLTQGWNWISSYIQPDETAVDKLFNPAIHLAILINGSGQFYIPGVINGLGAWQPEQGYKAYANERDSLLFEGTMINPTTPIAIKAGWNFIAYWPAKSSRVEDALQSVMPSIVIVKDENGRFFVPGLINILGSMQPGNGYKLYSDKSAQLVYPTLAVQTSPSLAKTAVYDTTVHFKFAAHSGESYSIIIDNVLLTGKALTRGDEVGVFTQKGLCVGAAVYQEQYPLPLIAWADDPQTDLADGYASGDSMIFCIWQQLSGKIFFTNATYHAGNGLFGTGPYSRLSLTSSPTTLAAMADALGKDCFLLQNYPNPFNEETNITIRIAASSWVTAKIYNLQGQWKSTLVDKFCEAGVISVPWRGRDEPTGIYLCYVNAGNWRKTIKLLLTK